MSENRAVIVLLSVLVVVAVGLVLMVLRSVLLPFAGAALLAFLFKPLVVWLRDKGVPMAIVLIAVVFSVAILLAALGGILYSTTSSLIDTLPQYAGRVTEIIYGVTEWSISLSQRWGLNLDEYINDAAIDIGTITAALQTGLSSFVGFFGNVLIVLLFLMFMLAGTGRFRAKISMAFSDARAEKVAAMAHNVDTQIKEYIFAKTLISLITGVLTTVICLVIGVDFAFLWGFLAFLLNFIPTFGSIIATIFPVLIAFLQFESVFKAFLVLVLVMGTQFTMGNVVEPRLMGARLNLSPLVILFSIILWAWLWGPWGMVMAVPITVSMKIVFENVTSLQPLSVMMSGVPQEAGSNESSTITEASE